MVLARISLVNKHTLSQCLRFGLLGVPDTPKAATEIFRTNIGERLFLYVHGMKMLYGVYRIISPAFLEAQPEKGPWNQTKEDQRRGFYPFRLEFEPVRSYSQPLTLGEVEKLRVELNEEVIRTRPSVLYLRETSASKLELLLDKKNERIPFERIYAERYPSQRLPSRYSDSE